eukprot:scaffold4834_cov179-Skeletonema_marinoi.AAC.5
MTSNTAPPHAPPVALDNIPDDFICSICLTVPAEPLITPCDHVFCKSCIHQALNDRNLCPIDRRPCTAGQLKRLEGLSLRVWSGIQVKCGGHDSGCAWRGSIADYSAHVENNCSVGKNPNGNIQNNKELMEELETLRHENLELKGQLENDNEAYTYLQEELETLRRENLELKEQLEVASAFDEMLVKEMTVEGAGLREINGTYSRTGQNDYVSKFMNTSRYNGRSVEIMLFRCKLTDETRRWYISIVPENTHPGTRQDIDFYAVNPSQQHSVLDPNIPPRDGWMAIPSSGGVSPAPQVYPKER